MKLEKDTRIDKWIVRGPLGKGGMGYVYRVRHVDMPAKQAAIKLLFVDDDLRLSGAENEKRKKDALKRFMREAELLSKLASRNIVTILDRGEFQGTPYILMELLQGNDVVEEMQRRRSYSLPANCVANIGLGVCSGLAAVHSAGVLHRDIKPSNIFIQRTEDEELVKIFDFGISRPAIESPSSQITGMKTLCGTPSFMAPEQIISAYADEATDQFALAVTLFFCLAARYPWDKGDADTQAFHDRLRGKYAADLAVLRPDVPEEFRAAIMKALSPDPTERFFQITDFGAALLPFSDDYPRLAYETSIRHRASNVPKSASFADSYALPRDLEALEFMKKIGQAGEAMKAMNALVARKDGPSQAITKDSRDVETRVQHLKLERSGANSAMTDPDRISGPNTTSVDAFEAVDELDRTLLDPEAAAKALAAAVGGTKSLPPPPKSKDPQNSPGRNLMSRLGRYKKPPLRRQVVLFGCAVAVLGLVGGAGLIWLSHTEQPSLTPLTAEERSAALIEMAPLGTPAPTEVSSTPRAEPAHEETVSAVPANRPVLSPSVVSAPQSPPVAVPATDLPPKAAAKSADQTRPTAKQKQTRKVVYAPGGSVILPP